MKVGPRYKVCKRLGNGVYEKCQTQKFTVSESRRSAGPMRRPRQISDYGKQLLEKQRVRVTYGITEKQLVKYVNEANAKQGVEATVALLSTLERRLDNIVYRLGLAPTRRAARQMVVHGHVLVDGKKARIPSHLIKEGQTVSVREKTKQSGMVESMKERLAETKVPTWLTFNNKNMEGSMKSEPSKDNTETLFDLRVVMEYYSR